MFLEISSIVLIPIKLVFHISLTFIGLKFYIAFKIQGATSIWKQNIACSKKGYTLEVVPFFLLLMFCTLTTYRLDDIIH